MRYLVYIIILVLFINGCASKKGEVTTYKDASSGGGISQDASMANDLYTPDIPALEAASLDSLDLSQSEDSTYYLDYGSDSGGYYDSLLEKDYVEDYFDTLSNDSLIFDTYDEREVKECKEGYIFLNGECVFVAKCDRSGLSSVPLKEPDVQGEFVKFEALVTTSEPSCSHSKCNEKHKCCKKCFALLKATNVILKGDGFSIGCLGTNCDYMDNCTPMKAEKSYIIWGKLYKVEDHLEVIVNGYCRSP